MNSKLICFFLVVAAVYAETDVLEPVRFPPGVDPLLCPEYPNCDNALLHGTEKIKVLPTYYKTIVPGYGYYGIRTIPQRFATRTLVFPSGATVPQVVTGVYPNAPIAPISPLVSTVPIAPIAPIAPLVSSVPLGPVPISKLAKISRDTLVDPSRPVVPFATSPGSVASPVYVSTLALN